MFKAGTSWWGPISSITRRSATYATAMAESHQSFTAQTRMVPPTTPFKMRPKLHGRDFYRAIGEPKYIVAPMVDRSEFAWRMLTRSYLDLETSKQTLAYTPMLHARLFQETPRFRNEHFQPLKTSLETTTPPSPSTPAFLDGNPAFDRPLIVQFCANKPHELLAAAQYVAPYCDAVDLNLGCPQGIARSGHYGAFLQEDWETIHAMINTLHKELPIPVTAKMRILDTKEHTLEYARMILSAGASFLTVHGRRREQKGHNTGLADWSMIRYLRDNLPPDTVLFANGNILNGGDIAECMRVTGVDAVMSAEGNLCDPTIFAPPPQDPNSREYWRSLEDPSVGGYRLDGVFRRYMDIIYEYVLEQEPPVRKPLWTPGDPMQEVEENETKIADGEQLARKKKKDPAALASPSLRVMQGHLFGLLKPVLSVHTEIRDLLARTRIGEFHKFEKILSMVEEATKKGLQDEAEQFQQTVDVTDQDQAIMEQEKKRPDAAIAKYRRPWWVAQPHIRPLPDEAIAIGALTMSKKNKTDVAPNLETRFNDPAVQRTDEIGWSQASAATNNTTKELPKPALVCG